MSCKSPFRPIPVGTSRRYRILVYQDAARTVPLDVSASSGFTVSIRLRVRVANTITDIDKIATPVSGTDNAVEFGYAASETLVDPGTYKATVRVSDGVDVYEPDEFFLVFESSDWV